MRWLFALLLASACGDLGSSRPVCTRRSDGALLISWTVNGQDPSDDACSGIDHLILTLLADSCQVRIAPVPCALDRLRYDHLPDGQGSVTLEALNPGNCVVARGVADVQLGTEPPAIPTPVAIRAIPGCR